MLFNKKKSKQPTFGLNIMFNHPILIKLTFDLRTPGLNNGAVKIRSRKTGA